MYVSNINILDSTHKRFVMMILNMSCLLGKITHKWQTEIGGVGAVIMP